MKTQFAIFGLERVSPVDLNNKKSGQPYIFRKYPKHFDTISNANEELTLIINGQSAYPHYKFSNYTILEIIPSFNIDTELIAGKVRDQAS